MKVRTINEDRGARKAADLRRRFREVSSASVKRSQFGLRSGPQMRGWQETGSRQSRLNDFLIWSALGAAMVVAGFVIF